MFRSLISDAKSAAGAVIGKYAIRVSVALPFLVAAGFGTAATTLVLIDRFGSILAYCLMAGGFAAIGLIAALAVTVKEQEEERVDTQEDKADTANVVTDTAAQAAVQLPLALLGMLLTTPLGPGVAKGGAKMVLRNLPLVLFVAVIGLLFWPSANNPSEEEAVEPGDDFAAEPRQPEWQAPNGVDRHAA